MSQGGWGEGKRKRAGDDGRAFGFFRLFLFLFGYTAGVCYRGESSPCRFQARQDPEKEACLRKSPAIIQFQIFSPIVK